MKISKYRIASIVLMLVAAMLFACTVVVKKIILPKGMQADSEVEVIVECAWANGTADSNNYYFVIGGIFPSSWNVGENSTVTFSTEGLVEAQSAAGYTQEIIDAPMVVIEDQILETTKQMSYPAALMDQFGTMGNHGDFEWVVWRSVDTHTLAENNDAETKTTVKIKMKTGPESAKFNVAFMFTHTGNGLKDEGAFGLRYAPPVSTVFETTGGSFMADYTESGIYAITPQKMSYEDIIGVDFRTKISYMSTPLENETDVYLMGKVVLDDGTELVYSETGEENRMLHIEGPLFKKYIYPRKFFNVPADKEMTNMFFWFSNADGSKIEDNGGKLYEQPQTGTPLLVAE